MSLLSLPTELLEQVCQEFCLHCQKAPSYTMWYFNILDPYTPPQTRALIALRRTCKVLAHTAQSHLYHRPLGPRFFRFVQILEANPKLGNLVRHLSVVQVLLPPWHEYSWLENFLGYLPSFLQRCDHMKDTQLYEDARKSGFNPMPKSLVERLDLPTLTTFDERQALLVTSGLSLMPNLVKLEICLGNWWSFRWCRPDSLPCLRELIILQGIVREPQYGGAIRGLLTAAPALERLELTQIIHEHHEGNTSYLSHANVKEVIFNACTLSSHNLRLLVDGFPNLQTLHVGWEFVMMLPGIEERHPFARVMADIVLQRKDTLRHLSLDLSILDNREYKKLQDLSRMTVLGIIHIETSVLMDESDEGSNDQKIHDILPPSIKEFGLMGQAYKPLYQEVLHLITTRRQHLRKVIVASWDLQKEEWSHWVDIFASACLETNIEFSTQEPPHWYALTNSCSQWPDDGKF